MEQGIHGMIRVFFSYSWESAEHKSWVAKLANDLQVEPDIHVVLDQYDLTVRSDKNLFMEKGVFDSDIVIVISTETYSEKANSRTGGVGIESAMNAQLFWEKSLKGRESNTIVVQRGASAPPRYLSHQFYINFSADENYNSSVEELLSAIRGKPMLERPKKIEKSEKRNYELTKVANIIGLSSKKRSEIISIKQGTDFTGSNKIKFEVWETLSPAQNHIIALHNNVNITQSLARAAEMMADNGIYPKNLTILRDRPRSKSASYPNSAQWNLITKNATILDTTYKTYTWDYCIDDSLKQILPPHGIDFYTEQEFSLDGRDHPSALEHLVAALTKDGECSPILVRGAGGIGKTSLCTSLVSKLIECSSDRFLTYLIRSEDIRRHLEESGTANQEVTTIYDLYQIQEDFLDKVNPFDRDTFNLSVLSGNLILAIDGLDELPSILKNRFDAKKFLESIKELQTELGNGRILVTSRPDSNGLDDEFRRSGFDMIDLLGFSEASCKRYLNRRFNKIGESSEVVSKIVRIIESNPLTENKRIVPFFVDVLSCVFEDSLEVEGQDAFSMVIQDTPYPSLNEITDHIVNSIFVRESTRHNSLVTEDEILDIFKVMVQEHGQTWPTESLRENISYQFDQNHREISELIQKNPLLMATKDGVRLKYDFLEYYFNSLTILEGFSKVASKQFVAAMAKATKDSPEFKDVLRYFRERDLISPATNALSRVKEYFAKRDDSDRKLLSQLTAATENIVNLVSSCCGRTKEQFSTSLFAIFSASIDRRIDYLFTKGDLPPIDFRKSCIGKSRFKAFPRFLESDFENSTFIDCEFDECHNPNIKQSSFPMADVDGNTCTLGNLSISLNLLGKKAESDEALLRAESKRYLSHFFKAARFRELRPRHMAFSNHFDALSENKLHKLASKNFIYVKHEKEIDDFYAISPHFQESVRRFVNNGYADDQMRSFFDFVRVK